MVFILMVSADSRRERLRESLSAQGWWVSVVPDRQGALRAAADHEPEVVVIDEMVEGAAELVKIFGSSNGGPGALVLSAPDGHLQGFALVEAGADEVLSSDPRAEELIRSVERVAAIPHRSTGRTPHLEGRRLTADEIFGDILVEVADGADAEETSGPSAPRLVPTSASGVKDPESRERAVSDDQVAGRDREASEISDLWKEATPLPSAPPKTLPGSDDARDDHEPGETQEAGQIEPVKPESDDERAFGQYRLEERIAVGGMAEVWRASMVGLEGFRKTVAIKKILPHLAENEEFVAMFVDEAKLAAQLNHENLVEIYDLGKIGDDFFIAMEYVDGRDLRSILNRVKRRKEDFPIGIACYVASRIAAALDYAHTRVDDEGKPLGLVHRDVSPRNILISNAGNIRLCDFGVAKAVSSVAQTEIGALKGKIQYMSPEQARGEQVDSRSDVFSLGSVLFETITGRRLFAEDSEISLLDAVRRGVVEEPGAIRPDLPEDVNALVLKALGSDPGQRYATAGELQADLEEAAYRLEPKPTQLGLAEWADRVFEEVAQPLEPAPSDRVEAEPVADDGAPEDMASAELGSESLSASAAHEGEVTKVTTVASRFKVAVVTGLGRWKFWLGVFAGLLLAVLAAMIINAWI